MDKRLASVSWSAANNMKKMSINEGKVGEIRMEGLSKSGTCGNARNRSQRLSYPIVVVSQTIRRQVKHMARPVSAATLSLPTCPCPKQEMPGGTGIQ